MHVSVFIRRADPYGCRMVNKLRTGSLDSSAETKAECQRSEDYLASPCCPIGPIDHEHLYRSPAFHGGAHFANAKQPPASRQHLAAKQYSRKPVAGHILPKRPWPLAIGRLKVSTKYATPKELQEPPFDSGAIEHRKEVPRLVCVQGSVEFPDDAKEVTRVGVERRERGIVARAQNVGTKCLYGKRLWLSRFLPSQAAH